MGDSLTWRGDRLFFPAVFMIGLLLLAIQLAGGAWNAEFNGYPDESSHFVTGQMIRQYVEAAPSGSPLDWAGQYYLHYPRVGLGHWPPLYPVLEALWSFPFGSSRVSAMWLQWVLGLASLTGLYTLARPRFPLVVTAAIVLFAAAAPVFQFGLEQTMAELACLLCSVLFLHASLRLLRKPNLTANIAIAFTVALAIAVKGTGICFIPVPFLIFLTGGQKTRWRMWWLAVALAEAIAVLALSLSSGNSISYWGGITSGMPWPVPDLAQLAGWGILGLAVLGLRREPLAVVCGAVILSAGLTSFVFRAMNEPRHWIIVLPAILLLSGSALKHLNKRLAVLSAAAALFFFPWTFYRQVPAGYRELIAQLHLPSRILISSGNGALGEGGFIAEMNIAEHYPASFVVRASKLLAESGWNGENYRLLAANSQAAGKLLDEVAVDVVVLDAPDAKAPAHHVLLASTMNGNQSWRICARNRNLTAWCRVRPPQFPRKPLIVTAGGFRFVEDLSPSR